MRQQDGVGRGWRGTAAQDPAAVEPCWPPGAAQVQWDASEAAGGGGGDGCVLFCTEGGVLGMATPLPDGGAAEQVPTSHLCNYTWLHCFTLQYPATRRVPRYFGLSL